MRRRLHTALVYFGLLEDRATVAAPPVPRAEGLRDGFAFMGGVLAVIALIDGDLVEALLLAACVLVLVAIGVARRRRNGGRPD